MKQSHLSSRSCSWYYYSLLWRLPSISRRSIDSIVNGMCYEEALRKMHDSRWANVICERTVSLSCWLYWNVEANLHSGFFRTTVGWELGAVQCKLHPNILRQQYTVLTSEYPKIAFRISLIQHRAEINPSELSNNTRSLILPSWACRRWSRDLSLFYASSFATFYVGDVTCRSE